MSDIEQTVLDTLTRQLTDMLRVHDWYYDRSDDHRVWTAGSARSREIDILFRRVQAVDPELAVETWNAAAPLDMHRVAPKPSAPVPDEAAHYRCE